VRRGAGANNRRRRLPDRPSPAGTTYRFRAAAGRRDSSIEGATAVARESVDRHHDAPWLVADHGVHRSEPRVGEAPFDDVLLDNGGASVDRPDAARGAPCRLASAIALRNRREVRRCRRCVAAHPFREDRRHRRVAGGFDDALGQDVKGGVERAVDAEAGRRLRQGDRFPPTRRVWSLLNDPGQQPNAPQVSAVWCSTTRLLPVATHKVMLRRPGWSTALEARNDTLPRARAARSNRSPRPDQLIGRAAEELAGGRVDVDVAPAASATTTGVGTLDQGCERSRRCREAGVCVTDTRVPFLS